KGDIFDYFVLIEAPHNQLLVQIEENLIAMNKGNSCYNKLSLIQALLTMTQKQKDRFWSKVDVKNPEDCWDWKGFCKTYGQVTIGSKRLRAHRVAYELANQQCIADGMIVRHICHNKKCCNPQHLQVGTTLENSRDSGSNLDINHI